MFLNEKDLFSGFNSVKMLPSCYAQPPVDSWFSRAFSTFNFFPGYGFFPLSSLFFFLKSSLLHERRAIPCGRPPMNFSFPLRSESFSSPSSHLFLCKVFSLFFCFARKSTPYLRRQRLTPFGRKPLFPITLALMPHSLLLRVVSLFHTPFFFQGVPFDAPISSYPPPPPPGPRQTFLKGINFQFSSPIEVHAVVAPVTQVGRSPTSCRLEILPS